MHSCLKALERRVNFFAKRVAGCQAFPKRSYSFGRSCGKAVWKHARKQALKSIKSHPISRSGDGRPDAGPVETICNAASGDW
eukprot:5790155-Amphidinium_carterae.1